MVVPRWMAKQLGMTIYFTGEPCVNGHIAVRRTASKGCVECSRHKEKNSVRKAFNSQKSKAKKRGIVFALSFDQWVSWWESHLGPDWFRTRGRDQNQFVMSRRGDIGPYDIVNVQCVRAKDNAEDRVINDVAKGGSMKGTANSASKLNEEQVKFIFVTGQSPTQLSKKFGVSRPVIQSIRTQKTWGHVTKGLSHGDG